MPPKTRWVEKPPPAALTGVRGKYDWAQIVADLQSNPGQWLLLDEHASTGLQGMIKAHRTRALRQAHNEGWTIEVRTADNNRETRTCKVFLSMTKGT